MSNFFDQKSIMSNCMVVLISREESEETPFIIRDQGGFIPTHEEIKEFIDGLQKTYSNLSESEIELHNQKIYSDITKPIYSRSTPKAAPKKGYVYLIKADGSNRYKIGFSTKPTERIKALQKTCPFPLSISHLILVDDMVNVERHFHSQFHHYHVNGEWFDLPADAINYFIAYQGCEAKNE